MCGATGAQQTLGTEEMSAYKQAADLTQQEYANQESIFTPMVNSFQSIFAKGPNQEGFSQAEDNALNSEAVEGTAENYKQAAQATNEQEAAEGGGNNPLPSGAQMEQRENVATSAAQEESKEENQITQANYTQGYNEWQSAASGLGTIASAENPLGYEGAETTAGNAAGTAENEIAAEQNSWVNAAIGAVGNIAGAASGAAVKGAMATP